MCVYIYIYVFFSFGKIRCMSIKLQGNRSCHFPAYMIFPCLHCYFPAYIAISLETKKIPPSTKKILNFSVNEIKRNINPAIERASNENIKVTLHSKP